MAPDLNCCGLIQEVITRIKHRPVRRWNIHNLHRFLSHLLLIFGLAPLPSCFLQFFLLTFFPSPFVHITIKITIIIHIYKKISTYERSSHSLVVFKWSKNEGTSFFSFYVLKVYKDINIEKKLLRYQIMILPCLSWWPPLLHLSTDDHLHWIQLNQVKNSSTYLAVSDSDDVLCQDNLPNSMS